MKLDPNKIGMIGFSAGGTAVLGSTLNHSEKKLPIFWFWSMPIRLISEICRYLLMLRLYTLPEL